MMKGTVVEIVAAEVVVWGWVQPILAPGFKVKILFIIKVRAVFAINMVAYFGCII